MSTVNVGSSLPAGSNTVGNVKVVDTAGTNQLAIDANNNAHVSLYNAANAMAIDSSNNAHVAVFNGSNQLAIDSSGRVSDNVTQIAGNAIATATTGVQKVGIVGNTGVAVDAAVAAGSAPTNAVIVGAVYNATAPAPTSGQSMALQADPAGNLRTFPGLVLGTLSAWNSGTSLNATQTIFSGIGTPAVLVQLVQTTTLTAGAITFEATYDGTNWVTVPANTVLDPTSTAYAQISLPYSVQASTNKAFIISSNGWQGLRIKLSTQITGSGSVTPNYALLSYDPVDSTVAYSPTAANFNATVVQSGTWTVQPGNTANTTAWLVQDTAGTTGGTTPSHTISAASNNATSTKASAGLLYGVNLSNTNASVRYVKFYDKSSAPAPASDTPKHVFMIPGSSVIQRVFPKGLGFANGIAWAAVTGSSDTDNTSVGSGDVIIDFDYK